MPDDENLLEEGIADDDGDDDYPPDLEELETDDDELEDDPLEDDALDDEDDLEDDDEVDASDRAAKRSEAGDGEFDDEVDPDNLEADLNTILRDRIAAGDDLDPDAETESEPGQPAEMLGSVTPRRDDEWLCEGCFLLVSMSQLGSRWAPRCPSGEEICPSLDRLGP